MELPDLSFLKGLGHWVVQVFIIIFLSLCINFIQKRILNRVHSRLKKTRTFWDNIIVDALRAPISLYIWILGISLAAQVIETKTNAAIFAAIGPLRNIGIIVAISWFFIRLIRFAELNIRLNYEKKGKQVDKTTSDAVGKILRASVMITSGLVMLQTLGFSISGVLAFGGIGGIAIGFAAKDLLANFFGAFIIYWDRPFKVGDWISSPDRQIEGTVEQIGWRLTCIRKFDQRPIYVPNAIFTSISVENPSRMTHRRILETIGVRYRDAAVFPKILADIRKMLQNHPEIDQNQTLMVNFDTYGTSSMEFFIYTFTRTTIWVKFHHVKEDVLLKIHEIITSHGAKVAYPTSTLHLANQQPNPQDPEAILSKKFQQVDAQML